MNARNILLIVLIALCSTFGCSPYETTIEPPSQELTGTSPTSMLLGTLWEDSVRDRALLQGLNPLSVRGYGLVVGLGTKGSSKTPPGVRSYMLAEMRRMRIGTGELGPKGVTPARLLDSKDTVVVRVSGNIPIGAVRGDRFDLSVQCISGGVEVDLRGGRLYPAQLAIYRGVSTGVAGSRPLAVGAGDIFVNPFSVVDPKKPRPDMQLDEGVVLGGGVVKVPRDLSIILQTSSYRVARQIERRINERFMADPPIAKAKTASKINISLRRYPPRRRESMLAVIGSIYLRDDARYRQKKLAALIDGLRKADNDRRANEVALALEGLGRMVLPQLRNLLTHASARTRFYAARAASRLGEVAPTEMFGRYATDADSPYQHAAIKELGRAEHDEKAGSLLRKLLPNVRGGTRIAVYEALRNRSDHAIPSVRIGDRFDLDIIHDKGEPLIFATVLGRPRIAVLGGNVRVNSPVFFASTPLGLTLNETRNRGGLEVTREIAAVFSPPLKSSHMVYNLVSVLGSKVNPDWDEKRGLGYKYGQVVGVLYAMCRKKQINARFHFQRSPLPALDMFLGPDPTTRPAPDADAPTDDAGESEGDRIRDEAGTYSKD